MTHQIQNIELHEGTRNILNITIQDPDNVLGDITGASLIWEMRISNSSPTALISKATGGNGLVITDGPNREVEVTIEEADTDGIFDIGVYFFVHELRIQKTTGQEISLLEGEVSIDRSKTRIA